MGVPNPRGRVLSFGNRAVEFKQIINSENPDPEMKRYPLGVRVAVIVVLCIITWTPIIFGITALINHLFY